MLRDPEEVFRFIWENRRALKVREDSYIEVQSVRPSIRIGPDGFVLHETVAEYIQILTLWTGELEAGAQDRAAARKFRATGGSGSSAAAR